MTSVPGLHDLVRKTFPCCCILRQARVILELIKPESPRDKKVEYRENYMYKHKQCLVFIAYICTSHVIVQYVGSYSGAEEHVMLN